jgi:hypothetical protein
MEMVYGEIQIEYPVDHAWDAIAIDNYLVHIFEKFNELKLIIL